MVNRSLVCLLACSGQADEQICSRNSQGALRPLSPSYLHKILELLLMHLVSLSLPHDAASVLDLSRSLEYEHEVRREVILQVMRWFGEVDAADALWKMDVEKVVRQVGLGILRQHKVRVGGAFTTPH